jgi:hypothetical protein
MNMCITNIIQNTPWWYWGIMIVLSFYYAYRGLLSEMHKYALKHDVSRHFKIVYAYIQEILFKLITTASSFTALLIANELFSSLDSINDIGVGTAIILIFLFIWGVMGITGYLTYLVVSGKLPLIGKA